MLYDRNLNALDHRLLASLADFLPRKIYDFHMHLYRAEHYSQDSYGKMFPPRLDAEDWKSDLAQMPLFEGKTMAGLVFGLPGSDGDRLRINKYIREQVTALNDPWSRCLFLAAPTDSTEDVAKALRSGAYSGLKVYHIYADRPDTFHASIPEYAPEWMWEILNETGGILLLHMVLHRAIADEQNQRDIRRLCEAYPGVQLVMAHAARCFNHRHSLQGLASVADLPNVWIDTSAVCEAESFANALRVLGPQRILYGSDYAVSGFRGRCMTEGDGFFWHHPADEKESEKMTLVGIESLLALREALEGFGATRNDLENIFWKNAMRCLRIPEAPSGSKENPWLAAREVISGGTGQLSKRAESFLTPEWPAYFSKASGCRVWDLNGRMFTDFVGGVGEVFLGYADREVNQAVSRRLARGNYGLLLAEEEVELAHRLLELHPGMGKVRYARGGEEAMLLAVRTARAATGKSGIAFCGYQGWHDGSLAANLNKSEQERPVPGRNPRRVPEELEGTYVVFHSNDIASLLSACDALKGNLAAIVMEPLRSQYPTPEFLAAIHAAVESAGALLVVDEATSGMRYGFPGISSSLGLHADLLVYAKAMSNGIPFGVVIGKRAVMDQAEPSFISSSYGTDGLGAAAALAVLNKMQHGNIQPGVWIKGEDFAKKLTALAADYPTLGLDISGLPVSLMLAFTNGELAPVIKMRVLEEMLTRGFLLRTIVYLMDAHTDADLLRFLAALRDSLEVVAEEHKRGALDGRKILSATTIGRHL